MAFPRISHDSAVAGVKPCSCERIPQAYPRAGACRYRRGSGLCSLADGKARRGAGPEQIGCRSLYSLVAQEKLSISLNQEAIFSRRRYQQYEVSKRLLCSLRIDLRAAPCCLVASDC